MTNEFDETKIITSRVVANHCGISQSTAHVSLKKQFGPWYKTGKQVKLTPEAELKRVFAAENLLYNLELKWGENYFDRVISSDESLVQLQSSSNASIGTYGKKLHDSTVKFYLRNLNYRHP
jgi:hypothetical protein